MKSQGVTSGSGSARELWAGEVIDQRFEVLSRLGAGGEGTVFWVKDQQTGQELALKILGSSKAHGSWLTRFVREYRVASRLRDPRLVRAHHFGKFSDSYYFTMDLVSGGSLRREAKGQQLPPGLAAGLMLQLLGALDAVHHLNITHRDVKPLNLLLEGPLPLRLPGDGEPSDPQELPRIRLTDFGIARFGDLDESGGAGHATGTVRYMAPEVLNSGASDPRVDLYAAGVVFHELLTGEHPLAGTGDTRAVVFRFLRDGPQGVEIRRIPPEVPQPLVSVVRRLLSWDPDQRHRTAALAFDEIWTWWQEARPPYVLPELPPLRGSPYLAAGALVGRQAEITQAKSFIERIFQASPLPLHNTLSLTDRAAALCPSVLVVDGVPGVGKSRLIWQLMRVARTLGATTFTGQCRREGERPYEGLAGLLVAPADLDRTESSAGDSSASSPSPPSQGPAPVSSVGEACDQTIPLTARPRACIRPSATALSQGGEESLAPTMVVDDSSSGGAGSSGARESSRSGEPEGRSNTKATFPWRRLPSRYDREYELLRREPLDGVEAIKRHELRQRFLFEHSLARLLQAAERQPTLIVVEDVQWADASSNSFLHFLVRGVALARGEGYRGKIAFCLSRRPAEEAPAVQQLEATLDHQQSFEQPPVRLHLDSLSPKQSTELVAALLMEPAGPDIERFAHSLFGGQQCTPLYVEQALRLLLFQGLLTQGFCDSTGRWGGRWNLNPSLARQARLPATVQGAMGERAARLSVNTQSLLALASVVGRRFESDLLVHALGLHLHEVLDCLDEAIATGYVAGEDHAPMDVACPHGRYYRFVHEHYRDVLNECLDDEQRQALHRRVAHSVAALFGESPETAERLFHHWVGAGDDALAAGFAVTAADAALEQGAFDQAAALYGEALAAAGRAGVVLDNAVHARYGDACVAQGDFARASEQYQLRLAALPPSLERWDVQRRAAELAYRRRDFAHAAPPLETLLAELGRPVPRGGFSSVRALFRAAGHALMLVLTGWFPKAFYNRRPASDPVRAELLARAQYLLCECYTFLDFKRSIITMLDCIFTGIKAGDFPFRAIPLAMGGLALSLMGQFALADRYATLARDYLKKKKDDGIAAIGYYLLVMIGFYSGKFTLELVGPLLKAGDASGDINSRFMTRLVAWVPLFATGRMGAAATLVVSIRDLSQRYNQPDFMGWYFYLEGVHQSLLGEYAKSKDCLGESCRLYDEDGNQMGLLGSRINLSLTGAMDSDTPSQPELLAYLNQALDCSEEWLRRHFVSTDELALALLTAAFAVNRLPSLPPETWRRIRVQQKRMRSSCMTHPVLAIPYRAACAALRYRQKKSISAHQTMEECCQRARAMGDVSNLVYLYRLAATMFAEDSDLSRQFQELEQQTVAALRQTPAVSYGALGRGEVGPGPLDS